MNQSQKYWIKEFRDILLLIVAGFLMTYAFYYRSTTSFSTFLLVSSFTSCMWVFLWKGNGLVTNIVSHYISWIDEPLKRFLVGMVTTIIYSSGIVYLVAYLFDTYTKLNFGSGINSTVGISLVITLIISLFLHGRQFYFNWKTASLNAERLEKENIRAKYDNLKSQVNPHFLFNSLNALTSLVYEDQDKAAKFIKQLSEVYRYVLDTREQEIVPLADELKFLNAYLFLQQIRFDKNLITHIDVKDDSGRVAPLSVQMLFENAIKHNVISKDSPLTIRMFVEGSHLVVENSLQPKEVSQDESRGMGLDNIISRYSFLTKEKVQIEKDDTYFRVRLPLIHSDFLE